MNYKGMVSLISVLSLSVGVVGCATTSSVPPYAAQGTEQARLRIALAKGAVPQSGAGDGLTAFLHQTEDCLSPVVLGAVYTIDASADRHDPARRGHSRSGALNMPLGNYDSLEVKELVTDAGQAQDIALQFSVLLAGPFGAFTRCNIALNQDFEPGKDYEILGTFDTPTSCSAVVNELVPAATGATRKAVSRVNNISNPLSAACYVQY